MDCIVDSLFSVFVTLGESVAAKTGQPIFKNKFCQITVCATNAQPWLSN